MNHWHVIVVDSGSIVVVMAMAATDLSKAMVERFKRVGGPEKVNVGNQVVLGLIRFDKSTGNLDDAVCKISYTVAVQKLGIVIVMAAWWIRG